MAKTLMIIGAGVEQVPAYEAAKNRGLVVVGTDVNPGAPGFALADHRILVSTRDAVATEIEAIKFNKSQPVHGVMTIANDVPYTVARTAAALGLPAISLDAARCVSDKFLMKERFALNGVACPTYFSIENAEQLRGFLEHNGSHEYVLKPVDGRGARGVLLINSKVDSDWAFAESRHWGDSGRLILEEFIPGMQLSTETFILDGKCYTPTISERNYCRLAQFRPNIIEDGGTIPAPISSSMKNAIDNLILRGASALGISAGIVKGDIVISETGNPMIIELAARLSGGWLATHQTPAASGVSLVEAVISYSLGEPINPEFLTARYQRATAIRYWFPAEGRISSIAGEEMLQKIPGLISYGFFRKRGDTQPRIRMHSDRFGYVIVSAERREDVLNRVKQALDCIQVETIQ